MSSITATRTEPTVTPRTVRRFGRWSQLVLLTVVLTSVAVLVISVLDTPAADTSAAVFDIDAANARLVSLGYLTDDGVHEYETTRDLQNRGIIPTAPTAVGRDDQTVEAETRRLISRGLVPAGTTP